MAIKSFIKKIKTVFSPYIENYDPPEPDPDKEGLDIEIEAVPFNHRHQGNTTPKISHNDLINVAATQHHSNSNDPTTDQKAAMTGANSPDASNVFATMADAGAGGQTLYDAIVAPSGGDYTTIQAAIDAGHTTIFVRNGTYNITSAITLTDKCQIVGESREETIIDGGGNSINAIHAIGSDLYATGTISINNDSSTVTGVGTSFAAAMVGRQIYLTGKLYQITAVGSTTSLTISSNYQGNNISATSHWYIANHLTVRLSNLTIRNVASSFGTLLNIARIKDSCFENLLLSDCWNKAVVTAWTINSIIQNCNISKAEQGGISLGNFADSNIFKNNFISKCGTGTGDGGIEIESGTRYNQIISNVICHNNCQGIRCDIGYYNIISNNVISSNELNGIYTSGSLKNCQIINNQILSNKGGQGIYIAGDKCLIQGNYFYDNYLRGIRVEGGVENSIIGNHFDKNDYSIVLDTANRCLVSNNYINSPIFGIYIHSNSDNNAIVTNYVYNASGWGIFIAAAVENDSFVHGNYFLTCVSGGLSDGGTATTTSDNVTK